MVNSAIMGVVLSLIIIKSDMDALNHKGIYNEENFGNCFKCDFVD